MELARSRVHSSPISFGENQILFSIIHDITERRKAEETLRDSEERLRTILEAIPDCVFLKDRDLKYSLVNRAFEHLFELPASELIGKTDEDLFGEDASIHINQVDRRVMQGEIIREEHTKPVKGTPRTFDVIKVPYLGPGHEITGLCGLARDVTERKKSEEALAKSQAELNAIFDSISDPIVFADTDRKIVRVNPAFVSAWGYSQEEVLGRTTEFLYPDKDSYEEQGKKRFHSKSSAERSVFESEYRRKDGTLFFAESLGLQVRDSKGEVIGLLGLHRDITDRKQAEERLKKSEDFLNATGHMAKVGGWELDVETKEVRWTEQTYHIHEVPLEHSPPLEEALSFYHPEDRPKLERAIERAIEEGEPYDMEIRFRSAKGKELWTRTICRPVVKNGKTIRLVGTFQDITEIKEKEVHISKSLEEKEVLLREIHHRVKNNLALINSLLSLRAEYPTDKTAQEMFDEVKTRIRSMAVAHEILYQSENLAYLSIQDYVGNLLNHILYSHGSIGANIAVEKEIEEVDFGLSTAIPLGFLLTELVSNCLKHAFRTRDKVRCECLFGQWVKTSLN
jgi:PAS domain S-box-containing protein